MYGALDISTSGMIAQRTRMATIAANITDIRADPEALVADYDPDSPHADERGYVMKPDIHPAVERINALEALRAYEANVVAAEATKTMMAQAMRLIA